MPPLLALGLLAVAGLLATRLPWVPHRLGSRELVGLAAIGCGALLGPGIGVLDRPTLAHLEPLAALATAWIGANVGASFDRRLVRRVPGAAWRGASTEVVATVGIVGVAAAILARLVPTLGTAWVPRWESIGVLTGVAALSEPTGPRRRHEDARLGRGRAAARLAALETAAGCALLVAVTLVIHPHTVGGHGIARDVMLLVAACAGIGLFAVERRTPRATPSFALALALLAGSTLSVAAGISPFVAGVIGAAAWVRLAPGGELRAALDRWERPMTAVLGLLCGAEVGGPGAILAAAGLLAVLRVVTRWGTLSSLGSSVGVPWAPEAALATIAQGPVALAAALGFALAAQGTGAVGGGDGVLSTIVFSVALTQVAALALAPSARPLTRGPVAPELSPDSSAH